MATTKITDLTAYTDPISTDVVPIVDVTSDVTKKVSIADLMENAGSGTEALPGISFDGDPDTGISRPGANQLAISTGGTGRLFVDSSGKLGLGTSSPQNLFSLGLPTATTSRILGQYGNNESPTLEVGVGQSSTFRGGMRIAVTDTGAGSVGDSVVSFHTTKDGGGTVQRLTIDQDGNVGIGTTSPGGLLDVTEDSNNGNATDNANVYIESVNRNANLYITGNASNTSTIYFGDQANALAGRIVYQNSNDSLYFGTNSSAQHVTFDSSGRLLVGASSSLGLGAPFQIVNDGGGAFEVFRGTSSASSNPFVRLNRSRGTTASPTTVSSGDSLGQLSYCGHDGADYTRAASVEAFVDGTPAAGDMPGRLVFSTTADGASSPTERIVIDSSGQVGIGDSVSAGVRLRVKASSGGGQALNLAPGGSGDLSVAQLAITKFDNNTTTSQYFVQFNINNGLAASGRIVANGANQAAFASTSDVRLKENIQDLPSQLDSILSLRPVEFDYVESEGGGHQIGFIAQELQQIYPDSVSAGSDENGYLSVTGWSKTEARLVKALQEALAKIETLEQRLNDAGIA